MRFLPVCAAAGLGLVLILTTPGPLRADGLLGAWPGGSQAPMILYPNWQMAEVGDFGIWICDDLVCPGCMDGPINGLTIMNSGNCTGEDGGDIAELYFQLFCGEFISAVQTMEHAGVWQHGGDSFHAWTWEGSIPWDYDAYHSKGCMGNATIRIYADVSPCPTEGCTIAPLLPAYGISDECGYFSDYLYDALELSRMVQYVTKIVDLSTAAPAETVNYTIYYGLPGSVPLAGITVLDTLPSDTTYVLGSAVPAPDPGWDPDPGPPQRLRWSLPGGPTTAGRTSSITFAASVNWGNEPYDPGSGSLGAKEASRLANQAELEFLGTDCAKSAYTTGKAITTVRRYLAWAIGDNDILFAPKLGMPDDEMIYEIFIRNESATRTWHALEIWDTVPDNLTVWGGQFGFEDSCIGWTMTPVCGMGSPSWYSSSPGTDVLKWTIDLPPNGTMTLRWKGQVDRTKCSPGDVAVNETSMMSLGQRGVGGDGHARAPRSFVHAAHIVLRTTYFSYMGHSGNDDCKQGFLINFYPLHKMTAFELRKLEYNGVPFAQFGGLSDSINTFVGTCFGGFPESRGGNAGCGPERTPAQYRRLCSDITWPYTYAYKLTSNAPLIWMYMQAAPPGSGDQITYLGATNESFAGYTLYTWRRYDEDDDLRGQGDTNVVINTSVDINGEYDPERATLVHVFRWDFVNSRWGYIKSGELDGESLWIPQAGTLSSEVSHYRFISSDTKLIVWQGFNLPIGQNDHSTMAPNSRTGLFVSPPDGEASFYPLASETGSQPNMIIGNVEPGNPTMVRIWKYRSSNPIASVGIPAAMAGTSGTWTPIGVRTIGSGIDDPDNPWVAGNSYDPLIRDPINADCAYKVEWLSGGRIQVLTGGSLFSGYAGGSQLHAAEGVVGPGKEFWVHTAAPSPDTWCDDEDGSPYNIMIFCPSRGMILRSDSGPPAIGGAEAVYTTTDVDQVVCFMGQTKISTAPTTRNWRFWLDPAGAQGDLMALHGQCKFSEKFYVAPFVHVGTHYDIIAPPVVYSGEQFWMTVVVVNASGDTKNDYCGVTNFTATDPDAQILGVPLELYDYVWSSDITPCNSGDDNGVKIFVMVTLSAVGTQTIAASDSMDGSIVGLTSITVVGVDIKLTKEPALQVASSGDILQFKICWSNYSSGSAQNFVVTDKVPDGMTYMQDEPENHLCGGTNEWDPETRVAYSTTTNDPAEYQDIQSPGVSDAVWLKWTIPAVGPATTGCVCFKVTIH